MDAAVWTARSIRRMEQGKRVGVNAWEEADEDQVKHAAPPLIEQDGQFGWAIQGFNANFAPLPCRYGDNVLTDNIASDMQYAKTQ